MNNLNIRNIISFIVSWFSLYNIIQYYHLRQLNYLDYSMYAIILQNITDFYFHIKTEIILHHFLAISLGIVGICYKHHFPEQVVTMLSCELSTIFLCGIYWFKSLLKHTNSKQIILFSNVNKVCFITSFFYTRIYLISINIIWNSEFTQKVYIIMKLNNTDTITYYGVYISFYLFFILNLYWFFLFLKIAYINNKL
jgi:hypothetical protein